MMPLISFLAVTTIGVYGMALIVAVSPTLTGALTGGLVLAVTATMGSAAAIEAHTGLESIAKRRPRHRKPGPVTRFLDGDQQ